MTKIDLESSSTAHAGVGAFWTLKSYPWWYGWAVRPIGWTRRWAIAPFQRWTWRAFRLPIRQWIESTKGKTYD